MKKMKKMKMMKKMKNMKKIIDVKDEGEEIYRLMKGFSSDDSFNVMKSKVVEILAIISHC